jgi:thioredoxin reductase
MVSSEVVIVGAGPAGLAAAAELGRGGVRSGGARAGEGIGASWLVTAVESLDHASVQLANGRRLEPGAIIAATGYGSGLEPIA